MKKIITLIVFAFSLSTLSFAGEVENNRNQVLAYFAQMSYVELWSAETHQKFMNKVEREGLSSDVFFSGAVTIQEKTLALLQALPVPDIADVKEYHNQRIDAVRVVIEALNAGLHGNMSGDK